jgi:hypothetical protein
MNVFEISGDDSNPNIWQMCLVTIGLNVSIVLAFVASTWVRLVLMDKRKAGVMEVLRFVFGRRS